MAFLGREPSDGFFDPACAGSGPFGRVNPPQILLLRRVAQRFIRILIVPLDLRTALQAVPDAEAAYEALSNSAKKQYLWWIHSAKRPATRANRIEETMRRLSFEEGHGSP